MSTLAEPDSQTKEFSINVAKDLLCVGWVMETLEGDGEVVQTRAGGQ